MPLQAKDRKPNNPVIVLLGAPGVGKTTLAACFKRPYFIDCDQNLSGPFSWIRENKKGHIDTILYDQVAQQEKNVGTKEAPVYDGTMEEVPQAGRVARFEKLLNEAYTKVDCDTVVIDSTTALALMLVQKVNAHCNLKPDAKWEFEQWRLYLHIWTSMITQIRDRVKTTILCAHEELEKDDLAGTIRNVLMIPGASKTAIPALVTDVWRLEVKKVVKAGEPVKYQRWCTTIQDSRYINLKASIKCPHSFETTQENMNKILKDANLL